MATIGNKTQLEQDTENLYAYAVSKPSGFTYNDVENDLGLTYKRFMSAVRQIRLLFATDKINLICKPQGKSERWQYQLVGTYEEARLWGANREEDLESRVHTMVAIARTVVNTTNGRTKEGKRARRIHKYLTRLVEDIEEINEDMLVGKQ